MRPVLSLLLTLPPLVLPCAQAKLRWPDGAYDEEEDDAHAVLAAAELLDAQDWMLGEELLAAHEADDEPPELGVFDELVDSDDLSAYPRRARSAGGRGGRRWR